MSTDQQPNGGPERPNIIFIMPDQLRYDFLSCYGATFIETPHIDSLAHSGILYRRAYSPSPVCSPARASLLTGRNAIKHGVLTNNYWLRPDLHEAGMHTWPELAAKQGYHTASVGKMHFYPWDARHGFQYRSICEDKRWPLIRDDYAKYLRSRGSRKYEGRELDGYMENKGAAVSRNRWEDSWDRFVGKEAVRFIREHKDDQPFAMMVGFPGPHCPYDPNEEFLDQVDAGAIPDPIPSVADHAPHLKQSNEASNRDEWNGVDLSDATPDQLRRIRHFYATLIKQIDHEVGDIIEALKETGQYDNTVIIFSSDHGEYAGDHGMLGKVSFYESSAHVPLLIHLPWLDQSLVCDDLVTLTDVTATILQLCGATVPDYMEDTRPLPIPGLDAGSARDYIFGMVENGWMIYDGTWKLCRYLRDEPLLFNLPDDPQEQVNRIDTPEGRRAAKELDQIMQNELMKAIIASHCDKIISPGNTLWQDPLFGMEGCPRRYPFKFPS